MSFVNLANPANLAKITVQKKMFLQFIQKKVLYL